MKELYRPDLKAHVLTDAGDRIRSIRHSQEYWESPTGGGLMTAVAYLREFASVYEIAASKFERLTSKVTFLDPREQPEEYRLSEEKRQFDSETFGFYQTFLNVPVWKAGLKVTVKQGPNRVVLSQDTTEAGVNAKMPPQEAIDRYRRIFTTSNSATVNRRAMLANPDLRASAAAMDIDIDMNAGENGMEADREGRALLQEVLKFEDDNEATQNATRLIRGRFWIYRYDAANRFPDDSTHGDPIIIKEHAGDKDHVTGGGNGEAHHGLPHPFKLDPVPTRIQDGAFYMVAEITFEVSHGQDRHVWRALVELETNAVLYLKPMVGHVNGYVHAVDPITKSGTTTPSSGATNAVLNTHRDNLVLQNLNAPIGTTLHLAGSFVRVRQIEGADITSPTVSVGSHFHYDTRTNNFASVSGYFHGDRIFRTMQDLGFNVATYMSNTVFPIPIDIRCFDIVNAHCVGDGMGGIGHAGYGLMDTSLPGEPLGRAADARVHLHEVLGHGILYEAVDDANMRFVHSAGDSLSLIYFDPESNCRGVDGAAVGKPGDLRFTYVPWHPTLNRRCDRSVAGGWAWNGSQDDSGYGSEEILATTLFNFYRSIGGDHPNLGRRQFASRMSMYLIMRAIGDLTPASDPQYARDFAAAMMATDALNWTSEGIYGGAYHKVIRWAFEKQGEYQTPLVTNGGPGDGSVNSAGKPPPVDVYINDGRNGEYPFQHVHWHTTTVWNRRAADGLSTHQEPELGSTNYAYVKVKNRGTQQATNVVVRAFHTKPGAGLNWPADFAPLATASINVGTINANNSEEKIVGPFEWTPNINAYGHDCMLMVVSANGDASNVDNFTAGETIPEWRLVPNDNNIAQRNVNPMPGSGGKKGLMAGLDGKSFFVGNPDPKRGRMTFNVILPAMLVKLGWRLELVGAEDGFVLASGAKREVFMKLHAGDTFTREDVESTEDRDIRIDVFSNDNLIGGMTYRLDPELTMPHNADRPAGGDCLKGAQQLADCLGVKQDIDKICVKEIVVSLKMKNDGCC